MLVRKTHFEFSQIITGWPINHKKYTKYTFLFYNTKSTIFTNNDIVLYALKLKTSKSGNDIIFTLGTRVIVLRTDVLQYAS
jgi:hypothetical protein